jgi:hypothetical protein
MGSIENDVAVLKEQMKRVEINTSLLFEKFDKAMADASDSRLKMHENLTELTKEFRSLITRGHGRVLWLLVSVSTSINVALVVALLKLK